MAKTSFEIMEIEGVVIQFDSSQIIFIDDDGETIELDMTPEVFDKLRKAINRTHKRSQSAQ